MKKKELKEMIDALQTQLVDISDAIVQLHERMDDIERRCPKMPNDMVALGVRIDGIENVLCRHNTSIKAFERKLADVDRSLMKINSVG